VIVGLDPESRKPGANPGPDPTNVSYNSSAVKTLPHNIPTVAWRVSKTKNSIFFYSDNLVSGWDPATAAFTTTTLPL
jgi:hypothetical protein